VVEGRWIVECGGLRKPVVIPDLHMFTCHKYMFGPDSPVGIATGLRAGRSGDGIAVRGEIFHTYSDRLWGPPRLLYDGYRFFPGGRKRPGRDADPSPPSSAEV
jgi:hypothetical protein